MTLDELKQIKQDLEQGVVINRATWKRVLDDAIESRIEWHAQYIRGYDKRKDETKKEYKDADHV